MMNTLINSSGKKMILHVCILDKNPISMITPLVDRNFPSDGVIFAYTKPFSYMLEHLTKQMKIRGLSVFNWELPDSVRIDEHKSSFLDLIEAYSDHELWLNASNGERHINLAAYEVFRLYRYTVFCIEPKSDVVSWIYPDNNQTLEVSDTLKVRHYLEAYGLREVTRLSQEGSRREVRNITESWIRFGYDYRHAIRSLNFLAASADNHQLKSQPLSISQKQDPMLTQLIDDLEALDFCRRNGNYLEFYNEKARFFANGGWLENYVFSMIRKISQNLPRIQDEACSVEVERLTSKGRIKNELDIAFLYNNRLHIIECKTKHFEYGEGNALVYKLDSLIDTLGGMYAKGMVISFLPLAKSEKRRAKDLGIEVIDSESLHLMESRISSWIQNETTYNP